MRAILSRSFYRPFSNADFVIKLLQIFKNAFLIFRRTFTFLIFFQEKKFSSFGCLFKNNHSPFLFLFTLFFLTCKISLQFSKKLNITVSATAVHYTVSVNITAAFCTLNTHIIHIIDKSQHSGSFLLLNINGQ